MFSNIYFTFYIELVLIQWIFNALPFFGMVFPIFRGTGVFLPTKSILSYQLIDIYQNGGNDQFYKEVCISYICSMHSNVALSCLIPRLQRLTGPSSPKTDQLAMVVAMGATFNPESSRVAFVRETFIPYYLCSRLLDPNDVTSLG